MTQHRQRKQENRDDPKWRPYYHTLRYRRGGWGQLVEACLAAGVASRLPDHCKAEAELPYTTAGSDEPLKVWLLRSPVPSVEFRSLVRLVFAQGLAAGAFRCPDRQTGTPGEPDYRQDLPAYLEWWDKVLAWPAEQLEAEAALLELEWPV